VIFRVLETILAKPYCVISKIYFATTLKLKICEKIELTARMKPEVESSGVSKITQVTGGWFGSLSRKATTGLRFGSSIKLDEIPFCDSRLNKLVIVFRCSSSATLARKLSLKN